MENKENKNEIEELKDEELDGVAGGTDFSKLGKADGAVSLGKKYQQSEMPSMGKVGTPAPAQPYKPTQKF